jgi:hypothetical protein
MRFVIFAPHELERETESESGREGGARFVRASAREFIGDRLRMADPQRGDNAPFLTEETNPQISTYRHSKSCADARHGESNVALAPEEPCEKSGFRRMALLFPAPITIPSPHRMD